MNAVIICATVWLHFTGTTAIKDAQEFVDAHTTLHYEADCFGPVEATESSIEYFKSKENKLRLIENGYELEAAADEYNNPNTEEHEEHEEAEEAQEEITNINVGSNESNVCHYSFIEIAPHTFKMITKCIGIDESEDVE